MILPQTTAAKVISVCQTNKYNFYFLLLLNETVLMWKILEQKWRLAALENSCSRPLFLQRIFPVLNLQINKKQTCNIINTNCEKESLLFCVQKNYIYKRNSMYTYIDKKKKIFIFFHLKTRLLEKKLYMSYSDLMYFHFDLIIITLY